MFKDKRILVVGYGKSGKNMLSVLNSEGAILSLYDGKALERLEVENEIGFSLLHLHPEEDMERYDLFAMSPGVPTDLPFIEKAKENGTVILGEIEIAYLLSKGSYVGITGTNGKTTTTTLTYEIFKEANLSAHLAGNIGIPLISKVNESRDEDIFITELSSFQLETIESFKPEIGAILNITPDHLNRHKTMENYSEAKFRLFKNADASTRIVLNYDDSRLKAFGDKIKGDVLYFSSSVKLNKGIYVDDKEIIIKLENSEVVFLNIDEIFIKGTHNVENVMAAVGIGLLHGISLDVMRKAVRNFRGVEHRMEFVGTKMGLDFYNDSKATNVDSSIKAVESLQKPTILIGGGMDKKTTFKPLFESFTAHVKGFVVFGETKHQLAKEAEEFGFSPVYVVEDLDEAVKVAINVADEGYNIVLSPACASWDMYPNFEKRGEHFKTIYLNLEV